MNDEDNSTLGSIRPPSASRGDLAMLARVEQRLFGTSDAPPQSIAHYRIIERLGKGGMGVVYAAFDAKLERKVAIKVLRHAAVDHHDNDRLLAEARTLARLSHSNVVQVHEVNVHEGEVYLVMELVEGGNLWTWQQQRRSRAELLSVYIQAGAGLAAAHEAGLVHRDFKPANVLVGPTGVAKVADFGLATSPELETDSDSPSPSPSPSTRAVLGTRGYIAPEVWDGQPADARSDQFGFCVSLWEAIVGESPFARSTRPGGPPTGRWAGPRWLRRVLLRGMSVDPSARWPSMTALLSRLRDTPRRRRWAGLGGMSISALATLVVALTGSNIEPACAVDQTARVWTHEVLTALEIKLGALPQPGSASSAAARVEELAHYQERWDQADLQLCGATTDVARAQICLERARARALVIRDALPAVTDPSTAARLIDELGDPQACTDLTTAGDHGPFTTLLGARAQADERELALVRVALARGQVDWARHEASAMTERSGAVETEALLLLGRIQADAGERTEARESLLAANSRATLAGEHELAFTAQRELSRLAALEFDNDLDASSWLSQAQTTWQRLGQPPHGLLDLRYSEALVHQAAGRDALARDTLRVLIEGLRGIDAQPRRLLLARLSLANALDRAGDHAQALRLYRQLLDEQVQGFGSDHPSVGVLAFDIGDSLVLLEQWDAAQPVLERALAIETRAYGRGSVRVAEVLTRLAQVKIELGMATRGAELASEAWATQQRELTSDNDGYGAPLMVLAWANLQAGRWAEAEANHRELLATFELDDEDLAATLQTLAWISCRHEPRCEAGRPALERVAALAPEGSMVRLRAEVVAADIALLDGEVELARDHALSVLGQLGQLEPGIDLELEAEAEALAGLALAQLGEPGRAGRHLTNASVLAEHLVDDLEARCERALEMLAIDTGEPTQ